MNELQIFKDERFGEVRTITIESEPWFVGKDVAEILGYSNASKAVMSHVDDEDKQFVMMNVADSQNGNLVKTALINESGLYSLILSSKLPQAKEFKRWVTSEVLPKIRKHGGYISGEEHMNDDELLAQAVLVAQRKLEERTAQLDAANKKIERLEPKAAYFDTVASADGSTSFRETAKLFKVGEKTFTKFIEESNYCYRDSHKRLIPYAERQKSGWFEVKEVTITTSTGIKTTIYTKITPKGRTEIFKRLQTAGILNPHEMEETI